MKDKKMKLNYGAERHPYSMFNVGRSMLDVHILESESELSKAEQI